jgi:hypothetical protein
LPSRLAPFGTLSGDIDGVQVWSQALPVADIWRKLSALFSLSR